jgi:hypothetical protein
MAPFILLRHFLGALTLELTELLVVLPRANVDTVTDIWLGEPLRRSSLAGEVAQFERCHFAKPLGAGRRIGRNDPKTCLRKDRFQTPGAVVR